MPEYVMVNVTDTDYNSHADIGFFYFSNGQMGGITPGGHSDKRFRGKTIVMIRDQDGNGVKVRGFAEVTEFSDEGRPIAFGWERGKWKSPGLDEDIIDER